MLLGRDPLVTNGIKREALRALVCMNTPAHIHKISERVSNIMVCGSKYAHDFVFPSSTSASTLTWENTEVFASIWIPMLAKNSKFVVNSPDLSGVYNALFLTCFEFRLTFTPSTVSLAVMCYPYERQILHAWVDVTFELRPHKDNQDILILSGVHDIMVRLDDSIVAIGNVVASPYAGQIRSEAEEFLGKLQTLQVLEL